MTELEIPPMLAPKTPHHCLYAMKGYFMPPVDGKYQFKLATDDSANFYMSLPEATGRRRRNLETC